MYRKLLGEPVLSMLLLHWLLTIRTHLKFEHFQKFVQVIFSKSMISMVDTQFSANFPNAPRPPGAEAGRRPAEACAVAFSKKAYVVFSYIHRESLMLICRGNLFRTKLGT